MTVNIRGSKSKQFRWTFINNCLICNQLIGSQTTCRCTRLGKNIQVGCLVWYFNLRIIPETGHKLRSFWAGPLCVTKLIALALLEIIPVYVLPREERLVSLDVFKLYRGEDIIHQNPGDIYRSRSMGSRQSYWISLGRKLKKGHKTRRRLWRYQRGIYDLTWRYQ